MTQFLRKQNNDLQFLPIPYVENQACERQREKENEICLRQTEKFVIEFELIKLPPVEGPVALHCVVLFDLFSSETTYCVIVSTRVKPTQINKTSAHPETTLDFFMSSTFILTRILLAAFVSLPQLDLVTKNCRLIV